MSLPLITNVLVGLVFLFYAWGVFAETRRGEALVDWVRRTGQGYFGEYWTVHQYIVGGLLLAAGIFFCAIGFSIFASHHDWWVLKWL